MARLPAMRLAVVALALCCCCCLTHAAADTAFPPGLKVAQHTRAAPPSCGTDDQAAVAGEAEAAGAGAGAGGRMELELEDYPGSGANDRHSPWGQQRRN
ncbi:uncharacterized protein LOC120644845 isoform X2 [Panicum virgatum]|uniref:Uncharacterized protein n=1 Tax=Panicum virgatum TaxID=38727 RepID=A0A8T0PL98_PANVG|nr:uncharacterized protein LOC120644845 isoform X2 [Panicum virgatum]KAG2563107.1 hypothetical protein PVAP13_8KG313100 [Panicum virgatum]